MNRRFEIEELVAQDSSRVVYRARDRETGAWVALRRLLPGGHSGVGLDDEEARQFEAAMEALSRVRHRGLRRVVAWGLDPVDRMPFHACEWVEGETLDEVLERGVLSNEAGRMLAEQALHAQMVLDEAGGGWRVAVGAPAVVVVGSEQDFWFSFWVEPLPVAPREATVVEGLAALVERAMGWHEKLPAAGAGGGLAGWTRRMRRQREATAAEALLELERAIGLAATADPEPLPVAFPGQEGEEGPTVNLSWARPRRRRHTSLWLGAAAIALALFGAGAWAVHWATRVDRMGPPVRVNIPDGAAGPDAGWSGRRRTDEVNARAAELARRAQAGELAGEPEVFGPGDGGRLRHWFGREVVLEGVLLLVRDSSSGKTRYLEFSDARGLDDVCGRIRKVDEDGLTIGDLKPLEGRRVRLQGEVGRENGTGRVVVDVASPAQIEDVDG